MHRLELEALPATSACAALARGSRARPEFLVADHRNAGLVVARWRGRLSSLEEAKGLADHVLSYCEAGGATCTLVVDGKPSRKTQRANAITFIPAGRPATWILEAARELVHIDVYIPDSLMRAGTRGFSDAGVRMARAVPDLRDPWLASFFALLIAEVESCARGGRTESSTFLDGIGPVLIDHLSSLLRTTPASPEAPLRNATRVSALRPFIVRRIDAYVQRNLATDIRLEQLADLAGMSVDHFIRTFREAIGSTPHQYLLEQRLDRACSMLRGSAEPVSSIARRCGFPGAAHFAAIFRDHRGLTPSQFRRMQ
jgi:AraC family transcriptional regulator